MRSRSALLFVSLLVGCGSSGAGAAIAPDGGARDASSGSDASLSGPDAGRRDGASGDATGRSADASSSDAAGGAKLGPLMGDFVGVNGFIDDPTGLLPPLGNVREYHDWQWNEGNGAAGYPGYPGNQDSFVLFGGSWDFDAYYAGLATNGAFGYPVVQGGVPWLNSGAVPPVASGASVTAPASYAAHADFLFQYAARYGATKVASNLLKLAPGQTAKTGLGTVRYIEDWNEEDAWWVNPDGSPVFSPAAYAAMASADADGDQGRMGKTVGMKNADPTIKLVMGGLAGHANGSTTWEQSAQAYVDGVRAWATANRGGDFPADVLNFHYYSFGPSAAGATNPAPALSPEDDQVKDRMALLAAYRDQNLPGKELWLTEFGYDTDPQSVLHAPAIGGNAATVVQGQWIVRYFLAVLAAGFDRAFLFASRDSCSGTDAACAVQFGTAGVAGVKGAETPKDAYYFVTALRARLATYAWRGPGAASDAGVSVYTFKDPATGKGAYVVWSPTSSAKVIPGVSLAVAGAASASKVSLVTGQVTGAESPLTLTAGAVTLDVSETPTIVLVDAIP
jgi:hypothetical protein